MAGRDEDEKETDRLEAFSDGVFSIAITLLVLDIKVPCCARSPPAVEGMLVTLVPFPAAMLAEHIGHPEEKTTAAIYSGMFVIIAILFNVLWLYASHRGRLLVRGYDREAVASITRQYRFGPFLDFAAFLLAFVNVPASVGLCALLAAFFALA